LKHCSTRPGKNKTTDFFFLALWLIISSHKTINQKIKKITSICQNYKSQNRTIAIKVFTSTVTNSINNNITISLFMVELKIPHKEKKKN